MISKSDKFSVINNMKSHTVSTINENKNRIFPVVITDKIKVRYNEEYNVYSTVLINNSIYLKNEDIQQMDTALLFEDIDKRVNFYNCERYHYNDRWYHYTLSADEPEKTFGIINATNLPYKSFYRRTKKDSFITRLDRMVLKNEIEPFILFINGKFVKWDDIDIIYDCGVSYIILHGEKYNYYNLINAEITMVILPFKVSYIGIESQEQFNVNFNAFKQYLNNVVTLKDGKLNLTVPDIDTEYKSTNYNINIGGWYYQQLRLKHLGLLPKDRIDLMRSISVDLTVRDNDDNIVASYNSTFNSFDKDSYDIQLYESICDVDKDTYNDYILFKFNDDGLLSDDGFNMICMIENNDIGIIKVESSDRYIYNSSLDVPFNIETGNYLVFKNGIYYPNMNKNVITGVNNTISIINNKKDKISIYAIYNNKLEYQYNNTLLFDKKYFDKVSVEYLKRYVESYDQDIYIVDDEDDDRLYIHPQFEEEGNEFTVSIDDNIKNNELYLLGGDYNVPYMDKCTDYLDFTYDKTKVFDDNYDEALNYLVEYNPLIFNDLYKTSIHSTTLTGMKANESLSYDLGYETRHGLKLPRMKHGYHETYAIVFVNGEIIETYSEMMVFPNHLFIPVNGEFEPSDQLEILYFNNINNNELKFKINDLSSIEFINDSYIIDNANLGLFKNITDYNDLKLFVDYPEKLIEYPTLVHPSEEIAFNISYMNNDKLYAFKDAIDDDTEITACSKRKFIYQRLYVDYKAYRLRIDKRFKYCDNQKQYILFINGRRMSDESFLITIPKIGRPFDAMYMYVSKFVGPEDRIELFYVPEELFDYNKDSESKAELQSNGYIEVDKTTLEVPFDNRYYMFFVNGKKIANSDLVTVNTNIFRVAKDTLSTDYLVMNPIYDKNNIMPEVKDLLQSDRYSKYEEIINYIKNNDTVGYPELDRLFNTFVQMSNVEKDMIHTDVARIAIINEIVRDFWVTSGYDYATNPFMYDYYTDQFITKDENGNYLLPSMDANPEINIPKIYELRYLYIYVNNKDTYFYELGQTLINPTISWEYNANYNEIIRQTIDGISIDVNLRNYILKETITKNRLIKLHGENEFYSVDKDILLEFVNGIYYGLIDEDQLQYFQYKPKLPNRDNRVIDEYYDNSDLQRMMKKLTKSLQRTANLHLEEYIIGNNNYFVYAAPKRLLYDANGNMNMVFYLPDINSEEVIKQNRDDKTTPIYTNGKFDIQNCLIKVDEMKMIVISEFDYVNDYGYTETYVVFRSNGFFSRLFDDTKFNIECKSKTDLNLK